MYLHLLNMDQSNYCYCIIETFHCKTDKTTILGLSFSNRYCL